MSRILCWVEKWREKKKKNKIKMQTVWSSDLVLRADGEFFDWMHFLLFEQHRSKQVFHYLFILAVLSRHCLIFYYYFLLWSLFFKSHNKYFHFLKALFYSQKAPVAKNIWIIKIPIWLSCIYLFKRKKQINSSTDNLCDGMSLDNFSARS